MSRVGLRAACAIFSFSLLAGLAGRATPYWIAWEGDDWPEAAGYERLWGDAQGYEHGPGAIRTLQGGVLTYDALSDVTVFDMYACDRPGQMDPDGPSEVFIMEWRLKIDAVDENLDPGVSFCSDEAWALAFFFHEDHLTSFNEGLLDIPFVPYAWHDYRVVSPDMRTYDLYIDGALAHHGALARLIVTSSLDWGETSVTDGALHHWDYFRFGVVPEPAASGALLMWVGVCCGGRRR